MVRTRSSQRASMVQTRSARRASMGDASSNDRSTSSKSAAGTSSSGGSELQKLWEGDLLFERQPNLNFVAKLECYMDPAISNLVSVWPPSLTVGSTLGPYSDKANELLCIGGGHFVVFKLKENHAFFQDLRARQSCGIIDLPAHVIVLYVSAEECCQVNGLLFPRESSIVAKFSKEELSVLYPENWLQLLTGSSDVIVSATASESDTTPQGKRRVTRSSRRYKAPTDKMPIVQQPAVKYAPFWKGALFGGPDGEKPVRICTLTCY